MSSGLLTVLNGTACYPQLFTCSTKVEQTLDAVGWIVYFAPKGEQPSRSKDYRSNALVYSHLRTGVRIILRTGHVLLADAWSKHWPSWSSFHVPPEVEPSRRGRMYSRDRFYFTVAHGSSIVLSKCHKVRWSLPIRWQDLYPILTFWL